MPDAGNSTIREVTPDGVVTTFAGSPGQYGSADGIGEAARFSTPSALVIDAVGNIYVTDTDNCTIRRITPAGAVTTLAGMPQMVDTVDGTGAAARLYQPYGMAIDRDGNLYVAEPNNATVRKVTPAGAVTTLAGSPRQWQRVDGTGSAARFQLPQGVRTDESGNLYVDDGGVFRRVSPAGEVTTVSAVDAFRASTLARTTGGWYIANASGDGAVFVGDDQSLDAVPASQLASKPIRPVLDFASDGSGNYFYSAGRSIVRISSAGTVNFAGSPAPPVSQDPLMQPQAYGGPADIDESGNAYIASSGFGATIVRVTPQGAVAALAGSGARGIEDGVGPAASFDRISAMTGDRSGGLYVADNFARTLRRVTADGIVTTLFDVTGTAFGMFGPEGMVADRSGNLFLTDQGQAMVYKITPSGVAAVFAGASRTESNPAPAGSADGVGTAARFGQPGPRSIAIDSADNLYVADTASHIIRKISPAGVVTTIAGSEGDPGVVDGHVSVARFMSPDFIVLDRQGNLYVADGAGFPKQPHVVRKITPAGQVSTVVGRLGRYGSRPGQLPSTLNEIIGPAVYPDGRLLVQAQGGLLVTSTAP